MKRFFLTIGVTALVVSGFTGPSQADHGGDPFPLIPVGPQGIDSVPDDNNCFGIYVLHGACEVHANNKAWIQLSGTAVLTPTGNRAETAGEVTVTLYDLNNDDAILAQCTGSRTSSIDGAHETDCTDGFQPPADLDVRVEVEGTSSGTVSVKAF